MLEARSFPQACVASPHYLASTAGLAVLASGGNALDAAIAANLTLGVVTPYLCGYGGDLFALIWRGEAIGYNGSGRAPGAATIEAVRTAVAGERMPLRGPQTVTVPGVVEAWFTLLERFGTRSFENLAQSALQYARDGFTLTRRAAQSLQRSRNILGSCPEWRAVYGQATAGHVLRQPDLARTIETLANDGPAAYYLGPIAQAIASHLRSVGGLMSTDDLAAHKGEWITPLATGYRDLEVLELPPNTQGVAVLEALNVVRAAGPLPPDGPGRQHLLIEAMKLALADRDRYVSDPVSMEVPAAALASPEWGEERARSLDLLHASVPAPGRAAGGGTAYVCAGDAEGMLVSLIQSNYMGFGSGVTVPGWGINLQNRGTLFSLDPLHVNAIAPAKRTLHTLIPALALRDGRPWLVFGTMGGLGQPQTHLQLLVRIVDDGQDIQGAISAPRWVISAADWSLTAERRFGTELLDGLKQRGHALAVTGEFDSLLGHAHAIRVTAQGYEAATDPRAEGAALGL